MRFRRSQLIVALTLLSGALMLVGAQARDSKQALASFPFEPAEELVYEAELSRSLLRGIDIADMRFTAQRTVENSSAKPGGSAAPRLRFTADVVSKGLLRKLFGVRFHQRVESIVDPSSFTVMQTKKLDEQGDRQRTSEAVFDRSAGKVVWTERDPQDPTRAPRVVTSEFSGAVQDINTVFYFLRTQPLAPGKRFELTVSDSGRIFHVPLIVVERKKMKTVLGKVSTLRIEPELFGEGRFVRGEGRISIWLTDDARHIPVQARISGGMGTVNIKLKSVTNSTAAKIQ